MTLQKENIIKELIFTAVRSSGAGGQHVNKTSSKIILRFNVFESAFLSEEEKEVLLKNLANKLNKEKELLISCQESRSQHRNKEIVIEKFFQILTKGLKQPKKRKATKPSKNAIKKRLEKKAKQALKKTNRRKVAW